MTRPAPIRSIQLVTAAVLLALAASTSVLAADNDNGNRRGDDHGDRGHDRDHDGDGKGNGLVGAEFDFAQGDLSSNGATVVYGMLTLRDEGKVEANVWKGSARDPIPAMADTGRMSPMIEPEGKAQATDKGRKVLTNPRAFAGSPQALAGQWWSAGDDLCLQLEGQPVVHLDRVKLGHQDGWGALLRSSEQAGECTRSGGGKHAMARLAAPSTVAFLSQRVFPRSRGDIKIKYQRFNGIISRLNGWDPRCVTTRWEKTDLHFTPGTFESVGKDVWRAISSEPQKRGGDMQVFSYLAVPQEVTPAGRLVFMDVGHDFNRNGRIDDDWGHIYAGLPIVSKSGDLGGMMMVDMSPVGIREIPFKGGCMGEGGAQLTATLGLIVYVSQELSPDFGH